MIMGQKSGRLQATVFNSRLGWFGIVWNGDAVARLTFAHPSRQSVMEAFCSYWTDLPALTAPAACPDPSLADRLKEYCRGVAPDFSGVAVQTDHLTPFGRRVVEACRAIPYGQTASYGFLAREAGSPSAARAVGQCMATNRVPLIVPCHRVVGAGGRLGGFSAPGGVSVKQRLLQLEGAGVLR